MKKTTLLFLFCLSLTFYNYAQNSCNSAIAITPGLYTVAAIDGDAIPIDCTNDFDFSTAAEWYSFTPTAPGSVTITSNLLPNDGGDTRLQIYTGSCGALTCLTSNDDVDFANDNYLSEVTFTTTANTTYYIAWDDQWSALGFDFELIESLNQDFDVEQISLENTDQYTLIPIGLITNIGTNVTVNNIGLMDVNNVISTVTVSNTGGILYTESSVPSNIASGGNQTNTFTGYLPVNPDTYTVEYTVALLETDGDLTNNTVTKTVIVSPSTYARDNDTPTGSLGIGADNGGFLGQQFDVNNTEDIISVTFSISNGTDNLNGVNTRAQVWNMVGGVPSAIIAETDDITILSGPNTYTANIIGGPFTLSPGTYVVTVEEPTVADGMPTGSTIEISTTPSVFTLGTTWVDWPTNPNNGWSNNEDFNFNVSYLIRPNFQDELLSVTENNLNAFKIYPNPTTGTLNISTALQIDKIEVFNQLGQNVLQFKSDAINSSNAINIDALNTGMYFIKIYSQDNSETFKILKN